MTRENIIYGLGIFLTVFGVIGWLKFFEAIPSETLFAKITGFINMISTFTALPCFIILLFFMGDDEEED